MIDFSKLSILQSGQIVSDPKEIFRSLPNSEYTYLRDVQGEVLTQWFTNKDKKNTLIKMNTGSGKTVIGLLILKSSLIEKKGPAVYIAPDNYLVQQVINEAGRLGIEVTNNSRDPAFLRGNSILVTNIYTLFNGKSVFGMKETDNITIGSIIIDDVHACLESMESNITLEFPRETTEYTEFLELFRESLCEQCEVKFSEITNDEYESMLVPYWTWIDKQSEIIEIISKVSDKHKFKWPLIKETLKLCNCVVTNRKVEVTSKAIPINKIGSFMDAERRVFMSATLVDDTPLISSFDVEENELDNIITPSTASDIGERLILVPQAINTEITDDDIKFKLKELSYKYNVVVISPSDNRCNYWKDVADEVYIDGTIAEGVKELREGHKGLVVFSNRYDGIDLPNDACRILVLDGLPNVRREYDKIEEAMLHESDKVINKRIQKIEQGIGRGVRSSKDYCVVFIMGKNMVYSLYAENALSRFSNATRKQIELSQALSEQTQTLDEIVNLSKYCLERNEEWKTNSKQYLAETKYTQGLKIDQVSLLNRKVFNKTQRRDFNEASRLINNNLPNESNKYVKGWLMQVLAEVNHYIDPIESQQILKSAYKENIRLIRPKDGIQYNKNLGKFSGQGLQFMKNMQEKNMEENKFKLKVDTILEDLIFKPETANRFEEGIKEIAYYIGLTGRRPENEVGKGPDVLLRLGEFKFLVIECKNGVTNEIINKSDCNQLNGSINWFKLTYDASACSFVPLMIHKGNLFEYASSPDPTIRILKENNLVQFKNSIRKFATSVVQNNNFNNPQQIELLLRENKLLGEQLVGTYTENHRVKNS